MLFYKINILHFIYDIRSLFSLYKFYVGVQDVDTKELRGEQKIRSFSFEKVNVTKKYIELLYFYLFETFM